MKSTDHRPPATYSPTYQPNNHRPTDKIMFKRLGSIKHSFCKLQTQLEKWKTLFRFIIYLNRIKVFDRMNNICYNFERSETDELIIFIF